MIVGVLIATWRERRRGRPTTSGSLTDLALDHGLRTQIKRLDEEGRRLRAERDELLAVLTRLAELLDHGGEHRQTSALPHARGPTEERGKDTGPADPPEGDHTLGNVSSNILNAAPGLSILGLV
jgi:hypothetical protein